MSNQETTVQEATNTTSQDAVVAPTPVSAPAVVDVQDVNNITIVRPDFVDDETNEQLQSQAEEISKAVLANPNDATITVQIYQLGSEFMTANTDNVTLMDAKIGTVMQEIQTGSPVNKSLTEIKTQLDLINPAVVSKTATDLPGKLLGIIPRVLSRLPKGNEVLTIINERKDSVTDTIDGLKNHLWEERDKASKNALELGSISNKLAETQNDLQEAIYVGQMVWEKLSAAEQVETDPVKSQALRSLVNDLAVQVVDIQTVDTLNVQSRMSAETLINNARRIQQGVRRVTDTLLPAVAINLMVKAAASQQASLVNSMQAITRAAEDTIADTATQTKNAAIAMEKMQSDGLINPDALQKVADEAIAMIEELDKIRAETEQKARATSAALSKTSSTMRKYADPLTNARHALEKAQETA